MPDDCCPTPVECVGGGPRDGEVFQWDTNGWHCNGRATWDARSKCYIAVAFMLPPPEVTMTFYEME